MKPADLTPESFHSYPPQARELAANNVALLRTLPLSFLPLLLRELINYDWKFPIERADLEFQLPFLQKSNELLAPFAALKLPPELEVLDWVNIPAEFAEDLSAHLWASHQVDAFRTASVNYVHAVDAAKPAEKLPTHRVVIVLAGASTEPTPHIFRELRNHGVFYSNVNPANGREAIFDFIKTRASQHTSEFAHWYIDGSRPLTASPNLTAISYTDLQPVCEHLQSQMVKTMQPGGGGPELLRSKLARLTPEDVGLQTPDPVLSRFQLSLLTEGSGTQIFSTTFVQWAAREALRRAQPLTLLARFTPRRSQSPIGTHETTIQYDPKGSLIDADMGAYYTWINLQRLSGAESSRFLVWHEGHNTAVAIAPGHVPQSSKADPTTVSDILTALS